MIDRYNPTTDDIIDVLRAARARLDLAWTQNRIADDFDNPDTCGVCAIGAIRWATHGSFRYYPDPLAFKARKALKGALPASFSGDIADYNDHPNRRKTTMLRLFDRAITNLEGTK